MIDGTKTTFDWQAAKTDICVLAVGSVEQHSSHLPVMTDVILGDYFGRMVAEGLDAALLPTFPYGTCFEHSAFRGSFSLRPETQMQIVRDLADSAERQGFRIMVLVNSHGGNFSLTPPARDINRQNRPLKILVINWWEFAELEVSMARASGNKEIHAGEWETSILLAIRPDVVGSDRRDMPESNDPFPWHQRDLTTFGCRHFNPNGALGFPSKADVELGRAGIESVRKNLLPYLRDRIARLRANPKY